MPRGKRGEQALALRNAESTFPETQVLALRKAIAKRGEQALALRNAESTFPETQVLALRNAENKKIHEKIPFEQNNNNNN